MDNNLANEYDYIVGIDFGTTYSSCCYATVRNPDITYSVKHWPSASIIDEKIPSVIAYSGANNNDTSIIPSAIACTLAEQKSSIDAESEVVGFGNVFETSASVITYLPFLLHVRDLEPDENNRNPAADFLKLFHQHVIEEITEKQGEKGIDRVRYCFTLQHPSLPRYKNNIVKAIKQAGIYKDDDREDKLLFIDSYTAMAKHFLKSRKFRIDDRLLICDADSKYLKISMVQVVSTGTDMDIKHLECDFTSDEVCSDKLDDLFQDYVLEIIKQHPIYTEDKLSDMKQDALDYFEEDLKYSLDLSTVKNVHIALPSVQSTLRTAPYLTLQMGDLKKKVYDPIIDEICKHVSDQHKSASINYVFLCGTLSTLVYMKQRLEAIINNVVVVSHDDLSSAHGAVYYGLNEKLGTPRTAPICIVDESSRLVEANSQYSKDDGYTHIIGVDFGTSFSKWYYSKIDSHKQADFDKDLMQLPTLSLYDENLRHRENWGKEAFDNYYYDSEKSGKLMSRFKLYLNEVDKDDDNEQVVINAIANYLGPLNKKINETMEVKFPGTIKKYKYCFTVPTIWSDNMKRVMRDTVTSAGIISKQDDPSRLLLVNEPEAAAIFYANDTETDYFQRYFNENPQKTKVRTLVCDAGGGTVDMATYEYFKKDGSSKYYIDEVTAGSGSLCGSSFLDDAFRKHIKQECNLKDYKVTAYEIEQMVLHFILKIKETYTYKKGHDTIIVVPNSDKAPIVISSSDMCTKIFDPIVDRILCLLEDQYHVMQKTEMKLDMIILTGGLGQSKYLLNKIEDRFSGKGIQIHAPTHYDQSVVRGAVELTRDTSYITRRIIRKSYGLEVLHPLVDSTDPPQGRPEPRFVKMKYDFLFRANNFMKNNEYVEKKYYVEYPNNAFISILSTPGENTKINSSRDPRLEQVFRRNIDLPKSLTLQPGDVVPIIVQLYLGQTEIKMQIIIDEKTITKQSFSSMAKAKGEQELPKPPPKILSSKLTLEKTFTGTSAKSFLKFFKKG